jgi:hypothetical protein
MYSIQCLKILGAVVRSAVRLVAAAALVIPAAGVCLAAPDVTLYDVDFNGPPHMVGATPAFGAGPFPRKTPTSGGQIFSPFGDAQVVAAFGPMTDRPVRLTALDGTPTDPILGGVNLQFDLSDPLLAGLDVFHAQVDVLPTNISSSTGLAVFFDSTSIHSVAFSNDGNIRVIDATGVNQVVGPYDPQTIYTVRMTFDRAAATWAASVNGNPVYSGPVAENNLATFRIAMTTGNTDITALAYVDNIKITAVVPEPSTFGLAIMACGWLAGGRRRKWQLAGVWRERS